MWIEVKSETILKISMSCQTGTHVHELSELQVFDFDLFYVNIMGSDHAPIILEINI